MIGFRDFGMGRYYSQDAGEGWLTMEWNRLRMGLAAITMILAANAGDTACQGSGMSYGSPCQLDTRGIRVEQGQVRGIGVPPGGFEAWTTWDKSATGDGTTTKGLRR